MKNIFKVFRNYIEFVFFIILKNILGLFSFNFASNVGGILVSFFGKFNYNIFKKLIKSNSGIKKTVITTNGYHLDKIASKISLSFKKNHLILLRLTDQTKMIVKA